MFFLGGGCRAGGAFAPLDSGASASTIDRMRLRPTLYQAAVMLALCAAPAPAADGDWGRKAGLPAAHSEFAVAELDGKIYVIGGYAIGGAEPGSVHVYDPASDR